MNGKKRGENPKLKLNKQSLTVIRVKTNVQAGATTLPPTKGASYTSICGGGLPTIG